MLGMKKQQTPRSVIGANMQVGGPCQFSDELRVDGEVMGDVVAVPGASFSCLLVAETGSVHGVIQADHIIIAGLVVGSVHARERLEMLTSARVQGDVHYKALDMEPGATITGQLHPQLTPPPAAMAESGSEPALVVMQDAPGVPHQSGEVSSQDDEGRLVEPSLCDREQPSLQDKNQVF